MEQGLDVSQQLLRNGLKDLGGRVDRIECKYEEVLVTLTKVNENLNNLVEKIEENDLCKLELKEKFEKLDQRLKEIEQVHAELTGAVRGIQWIVRIVSSIIALASGLGILKFLSLIFH